VNSKTIQKGLFDSTIVVNKTDVQEIILLLKNENIDIIDYYAAIALAGIHSGRLDDFIKGKR